MSGRIRGTDDDARIQIDVYFILQNVDKKLRNRKGTARRAMFHELWEL